MAIVYYDRNCVYCFNSVVWLIRHGLPKSYEIAPLDGETAQRMFTKHPELKQYVSVIVQEGDTFKVKSSAIQHLLWKCPRARHLATMLTLFPRPIRDFGYDLFAKNRDRMWKSHWQTITAEEAAYFIEGLERKK